VVAIKQTRRQDANGSPATPLTFKGRSKGKVGTSTVVGSRRIQNQLLFAVSPFAASNQMAAPAKETFTTKVIVVGDAATGACAHRSVSVSQSSPASLGRVSIWQLVGSRVCGPTSLSAEPCISLPFCFAFLTSASEFSQSCLAFPSWSVWCCVLGALGAPPLQARRVSSSGTCTTSRRPRSTTQRSASNSRSRRSRSRTKSSMCKSGACVCMCLCVYMCKCAHV
jgi:hypothetical protein